MVARAGFSKTAKLQEHVSCVRSFVFTLISTRISTNGTKIFSDRFERSAYSRSRSKRRSGGATCTSCARTKLRRNHVFVQYIAVSACVRLFWSTRRLAVSVARFVLVKRIRDFVVGREYRRIYRRSVWCWAVAFTADSVRVAFVPW